MNRLGQRNGPICKLGQRADPVNQWIALEKLRLSREAGYDVGVPYTVDYLLERAEQLKKDGFDPNSPSAKMDENLYHAALSKNLADRVEWVITYFFPDGMRVFDDGPVDEHGESRIEGEILRYGSRIYRIPIEQVETTTGLVDEYISENRLDDRFRERALKRLGLAS